MRNQYTIEFPTLERLGSFKIAIEPKAYVINVANRSIKCSCSELELKDALINFGGSLSNYPVVRQATFGSSPCLLA